MSEPIEQPGPHAEARDRLTDRVLAEALGAESPPDLSEAIASRHADFQSVPQAAEEKMRQSRRAWMVLLTTAASLMLAAFLIRGEVLTVEEGRVAMEAPETAAPEMAAGRAGQSPPDQGRGGQLGDEFARVAEEAPKTPVAEGLVVTSEPPVDDLAAITSDLEVDFSQSDSQNSQSGLGRQAGRGLSKGSSPLSVAGGGRGGEVEGTKRKWLMEAEDGRVPEAARDRYGVDAGGGGRPAMLGKLPGIKRYRAGAEMQLRRGGQQRSEQPQRQFFGFYSQDGRRWPEPASGDRYAPIHENDFITPRGEDALSTFSIDVDTASYSNVRRFLMESRRLPDPNAVRIEELVNYFEYDYQAPDTESEDPFAASMEVGYCPWKPEHRLVRIGLQGREIDADKRPLSNLVFLVDVSGSMQDANKLPLVIEGLKALTDKLGENDRVAIVVYAGSQGLVLPSTSGVKKDEIRSALGRLTAGGSTAGGAGLKLAYEIAERNQIAGGVNRVVLCTDGDFNVGLTGTEELATLVETRAKETGVFLTVLGFGSGNLNDAMLEEISGRGDGHYAYIDSESEARRVLSRDLAGTLVTIAKDVKIQVEFNPAKVASYRLIGYENRVMAAKDFNDDTKDAGEIGAGHTVTALYEVVPVGVETPAPPVDGLKYQSTEEGEPEASAPGAIDAPTEFSGEMLTLKVRYKQPEGGASKKLEFTLKDPGADARLQESIDFRWAASVAEFGMLLRNSRHRGEATYEHVLESARSAIGEDPHGYRTQMIDLVRRAQELSGGGQN
ncbi:von Willebrand factor [Planctomycetes bacterium MalM25]|nr:von Willebrand factor [Planctomycetes bacterium MalM25]